MACARLVKNYSYHFSLTRRNKNNFKGITDSPLCIACMEADETLTHVLLRCSGVAEKRAAYFGSSASLPEALGDLGGLLSFWSELGWLE
ncbi:jg8440 [Pararge aegeria aegeria]|uniref:Jg8440 protein n=1 Tax=Pararge aegeria aegeria TaxID=348720 RepID=A0A8S4SH33_9NEOP|nr:jg8440 [Pararge aegeria aegeria]